MLEFDPGHHLEQLAGDMAGRALAAGAHIDFAGVGLGIGDELGRRCGRHRRVHQHDQRRADRDRHRRQVDGEPETDIGVERLVHRVARIGHEQRVTVGRRAHGELGGDVGGAARTVLDHERLAEPLRQPLRHHARGDICRAARRDGDQDPDRAGRIGLRVRRRRQGRQHRGAGNQAEKAAS